MSVQGKIKLCDWRAGQLLPGDTRWLAGLSGSRLKSKGQWKVYCLMELREWVFWAEGGLSDLEWWAAGSMVGPVPGGLCLERVFPCHL